MKLTDIISKSEKPALYTAGTSFMWTDEHISKQLLEVHLNPDVDLASRKRSTIEQTAKWILSLPKESKTLKILDLGCGPGLYSEIFAGKGHQVTGVDISKNSIDYARKSAQDKGLDIEYINSSYLELQLEDESYDLVVLIYTDLGVLIPSDRDLLLSKVQRMLKPGGIFIFDLLGDMELEQKVTPKNWEVSNVGFWKNEPYLALSESFLYPEHKVIVYQHVVVDEGNNAEVYRFWTHFFSQEDITLMMKKHGFIEVDSRDDILPKSDIWNGENVIFTVVTKK
ncbi:MAG: methyltransferase domain-containing protein [Bacteroidales bacterium]|nr:methyltransferase domain-containing protein [Bacteroidales bacterium]